MRGSGLERQSSYRPLEGMRSVELRDAGARSASRLALGGGLAGAASLALDTNPGPDPAPASTDGEPALPFRRGLGSVFANASVPLAASAGLAAFGSARPPRSPSMELATARAGGGNPNPAPSPGQPAQHAQRQDTPAVRPGGFGQWGRPAAAERPGGNPNPDMPRHGSMEPRPSVGISGMPFRRGLEQVRGHTTPSPHANTLVSACAECLWHF